MNFLPPSLGHGIKFSAEALAHALSLSLSSSVALWVSFRAGQVNQYSCHSSKLRTLSDSTWLGKGPSVFFPGLQTWQLYQYDSYNVGPEIRYCSPGPGCFDHLEKSRPDDDLAQGPTVTQLLAPRSSWLSVERCRWPPNHCWHHYTGMPQLWKWAIASTNKKEFNGWWIDRPGIGPVRAALIRQRFTGYPLLHQVSHSECTRSGCAALLHRWHPDVVNTYTHKTNNKPYKQKRVPDQPETVPGPS